jgi:hypothetical protein
VFQTSLQTIPAKNPYLFADSGPAGQWKTRVADKSGLKVGLVWAGGRDNITDCYRSAAPEDLSPLMEIPGVTFVSLQKGEDGRPRGGLKMIDWTAELNNFADTAALVANLDLVITVDTAVAHLAAAMGKPVWILTAHMGDWRWMLGRDDSPWYPTARLFRQSQLGDWKTPVARVAQQLRQLAGK